ncbi:hypothetical protein CPT03_13610 [Pedobacter ginsengisoli]|uniref:5'-nucleotidase n=1 Tax=Pedobacter ginsengisoli TaxID=363852 RepID=A0A2D1U7A1_9SPHI|nr:hypothetical protein [Pedobacter ginsengisoli]ATP57434.1 hypothetical protein CPT03_13610 [Pedobacter ginsengisoli]
MESKRRFFLKSASVLAGAAVFGKPLTTLANVSKTINGFSRRNELIVYHTANLNGYIESGKGQQGGLNEINKLIQDQEAFGLIIDAGNFIGKADDMKVISKMNKMGYHAATIGVAELRNGEEGLATFLPFMNFPLVNCNYSFSNPVLSSRVKTSTIIYSGNLKIGITGLGAKTGTDGVRFQNPYLALNRTAELLKVNERCDLVICLSNLDAEDKTYNNIELANKSVYVDFIIGKNSTKVMRGAMICRNSRKEEVMLTQVGYDGLIVGKTSFMMNGLKEKNGFAHQYLAAGMPLQNNPKYANQILNRMVNSTV